MRLLSFEIIGEEEAVKEAHIRWKRCGKRRLIDQSEMNKPIYANDLIVKDGDSGTTSEKILLEFLMNHHSGQEVWVAHPLPSEGRSTYTNSIDCRFCSYDKQKLIDFFLTEYGVNMKEEDIQSEVMNSILQHFSGSLSTARYKYYVKVEIKTACETECTKNRYTKTSMDLQRINLNNFTILIMGLRLKGCIEFYIAHKDDLVTKKLKGLGRKTQILTKGRDGGYRIQISSTCAKTDNFFSEQFSKFSYHFCNVDTNKQLTFDSIDTD